MTVARFVSLAAACGILGWCLARGLHPRSVAILAAIGVALIRFPEQIDEYTLGRCCSCGEA